MRPEEVSEFSKKICERILTSKAFQKADIILAYYPLGNEVDCLTVVAQAIKEGKRVALPKTADNGQMDFYEIQNLSELEEGNFHIMEPKKECIKFEPAAGSKAMEKILVLVPGVVFDRKGNRYGYGGGYYDRYFERYPGMMRIALAYSKQISEETLECLVTDVKMNMIVMETDIIKTK